MEIGSKLGHYEILEPARAGAIGELIARAEEADGMDTRTLRAGDTLDIQTCYSRYTVRLADPSRGVGMATSDGRFITSESDVRLLGATLSGRGTLVKLGWVLFGYKVVLSVPGGDLVTSRVQGLTVNGMPLIPAAGTH